MVVDDADGSTSSTSEAGVARMVPVADRVDGARPNGNVRGLRVVLEHD